MPSLISALSLAGAASALAIDVQTGSAGDYIYFPVDFDYGVNSRFTSNLTFGTASNPNPVQVVVDTGSASFWTWGPNATVNWGSTYTGDKGPCNITVPTGYDPSLSPSAVLSTNHSLYAFSYAGNAKIVRGTLYANDSVTPLGGSGPIPNVQLAVPSTALFRQGDDGTCDPIDFDKGILGLAPTFDTNPLVDRGPQFRRDLYNEGVLASEVLFLWMDRFTGPLGQTLKGGMLLSAVDTSKYEGELVRVETYKPEDTLGVFVTQPNVTIGGTTFQPDMNETCLVDSGSHADSLPFSYGSDVLAAFLNSTGVKLVDRYGIITYSGTCDSIPADLNITYTFAGAKEGEHVSIDIPLRNFARGYKVAGTDGLCMLNLEYGGCTLGATFLTGAAMALDNADKSVAFAQGGVSPMGSGLDKASVKTIARGQSYDSV